MSDQLTEEDRKVSIDRLVNTLKTHGDPNMSEKELVELARKTEELAFSKYPTNKKEYFQVIASKLMRITQRTTQKPTSAGVSGPSVTPVANNPGIPAVTQPITIGMNVPSTGLYNAPAVGMPIQRTNINVSGTASNPIAISTNTVASNPNTMQIPGYSTAPQSKVITAPQPAPGTEDADWEKYTEKHIQLSNRYSPILEQMMKQFEKAAEAGNNSFEGFKNRIQNFYRILKEPNFRPNKTPEECVKTLEVMEKQIENWVQSITQRKLPASVAQLGHPPPVHLQPQPAQPAPPVVSPPVTTSNLSPAPVSLSPVPQLPTTFASPQTPTTDKLALPPQSSPPIVPTAPTVATTQRVSEDGPEGSIDEFFTPGIITTFFDKLTKSTQDLKEMKTVLERITKAQTEDISGITMQSEDTSLISKLLRPPSSSHHKRFWWSRDSNADLEKVKQEQLKSSDGSPYFGVKRPKKNDESLNGVDTDFSGMHPIFPSVAKAARALMKNPEGRCLKRVFKSMDESKLFVELVLDEHKPEAAGTVYLMQLELLPNEKTNNDVGVSVTVKRTIIDKGHDSTSTVLIPALIELEALSYFHESDTDKWVGFISCYKRYLEKYNALLNQIEELRVCGYEISSNINHDATVLLSCHLGITPKASVSNQQDSQVLVPPIQVIVTLGGNSHRPPEIQYSEEHDLFLSEVKAKLESKIRSLSRVVQQPTLPLLLSSWKSIVELQYL